MQSKINDAEHALVKHSFMILSKMSLNNNRPIMCGVVFHADQSPIRD